MCLQLFCWMALWPIQPLQSSLKSNCWGKSTPYKLTKLMWTIQKKELPSLCFFLSANLGFSSLASKTIQIIKSWEWILFLSPTGKTREAAPHFFSLPQTILINIWHCGIDVFRNRKKISVCLQYSALCTKWYSTLVNEIKSWKRELSYVGWSAITIQTLLCKTGHLLSGYCQHRYPTSITNPTPRFILVSMYTFTCKEFLFCNRMWRGILGTGRGWG